MILAALALSLPSFEFRDIRANQERPLFGCTNVRDTAAAVCKHDHFKMSGITAFDVIGIYDGKGLAGYSFRILSGTAPTAAAALTAKYGKPCAVSEQPMQNPFGQTLMSLVYEWCFSDGKARLETMSETKDTARFTFDTGRTVNINPVVDF